MANQKVSSTTELALTSGDSVARLRTDINALRQCSSNCWWLAEKVLTGICFLALVGLTKFPREPLKSVQEMWLEQNKR